MPLRPEGPVPSVASGAGAETPAPGLAPGQLTDLLLRLAAGPPGLDAPAPVAPGARLGRFELSRELGRGGFGVVYEARDALLGRTVALKLLHRGRGLDPANRALLEEAEAGARLHHHGIVAIHDLGEHEGRPYLVMELLEGRSLAERLAGGPLPRVEALRIATEVARALAHAHDRGVLHRDLKPGNVFLCTDGSVKLLDFGLAGLAGSAKDTPGGTAGYMPPERGGGGEDARGDLFALGVVLREMLTGVGPAPPAPASGGGAGEAARTSPARLPRDLADAVSRLTAVDPAARLASGAAALALLERLARGRRRRLAPWLAALAVAAGLGAAAVLLTRFGPPSTAPVGVVVADATNETGEASLDAVSGMLVTSLEQSPRLRVVTRDRALDLLRLAGHGDVRRLDGGWARAAGTRAAAEVVLLPSLRRSGSGYALEVRASAPAEDGGRPIATAEATGPGAVAAVVDRAAARIREELGEPASEREASSVEIARAVTPDPEAYAAYAGHLATRWDQFDYAVNRRLLVHALERDPAFALAWAELARVDQARNVSRREVRAESERAISAAGSLPARERLLVRAFDASIHLDFDAALALYREALARFPDDKTARTDTAHMLWLDAGRRPEALPLLDEALRLDPGLASARVLRDRIWCGAGRCREAVAEARAAAESDPSYGHLRLLSYVLLWQGDAAAFSEVARRIAGLRLEGAAPWQMLYPLAAALYLEGDAAEAERLTSSAGGPGAVLAFLHVARGRWREARTLLDAGPWSGYEIPNPQERRLELLAGIAPGAPFRAEVRRACAEEEQCGPAAFAALLAGDVELAREVVRGSANQADVSIPRQLVDAWDLLRAGNAGAASARARAVALPDVLDRLNGSFLVGELCFAARDWRCALDAYAAFRSGHSHPAPFWHPFVAWATPRSQLRSAAALAQLGRFGEARAELARLLPALREADPDLPVLLEARRLQARLARTAP